MTAPPLLVASSAEPGVEPPRSVVSQQLDSLLASGKVKCLLTYGSLGGAAFVPSLLREKGRTDIKVIQGVWLDDYDGNNAPNDAQIGAYYRPVLPVASFEEPESLSSTTESHAHVTPIVTPSHADSVQAVQDAAS